MNALAKHLLNESEPTTIDPNDTKWTEEGLVNAIIGACSNKQHQTKWSGWDAMRYVLSHLSREDLVDLYNDACSGDYATIASNIDKTRGVTGA